MKEAMFASPLENGAVQCGLCPHRCKIKKNQFGLCGVRQNQEGTLFSLVYGRAVALNVDPIEKKPLFHFYPGSLSYSMATVGCNLHCRHCQNADISQMPVDKGAFAGRDMAPEKIVRQAGQHGCESISYTYTEPTVYFEYAYDTCRIAREAGLKNVFVSNGYMQSEAITAIQPYLDAANIDLKSFRNAFYQKICKAALQPVLDTIQYMKKLNIWVEVTTLVIPGLNDEEEELKDIALFLKNLDPNIPWHVSAFHPTYKMTDRPRTPVKTIRRAWEIGKEAGLRFVYTGNIPGEEGENTCCPSCGVIVISRYGYRISKTAIDQGRCRACKEHLPILMD